MINQKEALFHSFMEYWNKEIEQYKNKSPKNLYSPIHYIAEGEGKRMRPLFMLLAAQLFKDHINDTLVPCFCVELFHNFTLLHDDIMDEAPLRRGRTTVHEKWDTNTAILSGDLMMIESLKHLQKITNHSLRSRVTDHFLVGAVAVCEGQQMDMDFETRDDVSLEEYIKMIRFKTAALLGEGMAMAVTCSGASISQTQLIRDFGYNIGIAFQIQDDILDTYGDPAKFGKKVGGDIAQNKKTFLYLKALELANATIKKEILYFYSENCTLPEDEKIKTVTSLFNQLRIKKVAEKEKEKYITEGFKCLQQLDFSDEKIKEIQDFSILLAHRQK